MESSRLEDSLRREGGGIHVHRRCRTRAVVRVVGRVARWQASVGRGSFLAGAIEYMTRDGSTTSRTAVGVEAAGGGIV